MKVHSFGQPNSQKKGTFADLMKTMYQHIKTRLVYRDVYFVFNRDHLYSNKGSMAENQIQNIVNITILFSLTPFPGRKKALSSLSN